MTTDLVPYMPEIHELADLRYELFDDHAKGCRTCGKVRDRANGKLCEVGGDLASEALAWGDVALGPRRAG